MPWQWLHGWFDYPALIRAFDVIDMARALSLFAFLVWASWSTNRVLRTRVLIAALLLWVGGGNLVAAALPSAGPCYYGLLHTGDDPYQALLAELDAHEAAHGTLFARLNQRGLWALHLADQSDVFAGISAMPSLHVGIAVLFALIAWQASPMLGALLAVYALAIQLGSVLLAWHYAIDGYVGAALAVLAWRAAAPLASPRTPSPCSPDS